MSTSTASAPTPHAHDDSGGSGRIVVMLPSVGDLRREYRLLAGPLVAAGYRVVTADLPGHGDSRPGGHNTVATPRRCTERNPGDQAGDTR